MRRGRQMYDVIAASAVYECMTLMPNNGPVLTTADAQEYYDDAVRALILQGFAPKRARRFPRMTLYLHPGLTPAEIKLAKESGIVTGVKFYPKNPIHGTTGAEYSVPSLTDIPREVFESLNEHQLHLLLHGESASHDRILELEAHFVKEQLAWIVEEYPGLPISLEHVTSKAGVDFVMRAPPNVTATITPQHLLHTFDSLFEGGLRAFRYCLPLYKHPEDRAALIEAATSGNPKFCCGDDTAPHPKHGSSPKSAKLVDCGCAGAFVAPVSIPLYTAVFERVGALDDRFEAFMSRNGAIARSWPLSDDDIIIERRPWTVPDDYPYADNVVVPFCAGEELAWQVAA
ncbi:MAG: dihydroorotase [Candidatus Moraniibacteriota bacterium]|nr:MAG: dihydroorotase [Candidatus Moranbacteria bacterium]